jgi:hypothetical protein
MVCSSLVHCIGQFFCYPHCIPFCSVLSTFGLADCGGPPKAPNTPVACFAGLSWLLWVFLLWQFHCCLSPPGYPWPPSPTFCRTFSSHISESFSRLAAIALFRSPLESFAPLAHSVEMVSSFEMSSLHSVFQCTPQVSSLCHIGVILGSFESQLTSGFIRSSIVLLEQT